MLRAFALLCLVSLATPNTATARNLSPNKPAVSQSSICKVEYRRTGNGIVVAAVNCGLGQTCEDGKTCCRLGASVSCCDSNEKCSEGMCEPK
jgi:hypothetical protein